MEFDNSYFERAMKIADRLDDANHEKVRKFREQKYNFLNEKGYKVNPVLTNADIKKIKYDSNKRMREFGIESTRNNKRNWEKQVKYETDRAKARGIDFTNIPEEIKGDVGSHNAGYFHKINSENPGLIAYGDDLAHDPFTKLHEIGHSHFKGRDPKSFNNQYPSDAETIKEETRANQNIIDFLRTNPNINKNSKKQMLVDAEKYKQMQVDENYKLPMMIRKLI